ncbi:MAG: ribbon-helix-helix domain-containing protein [Bifidobacteriaceae bacterium]|jgi:predicted GNAT superfamily acetyltransferase|nr:ribbon-helix-helix domain-containing protein [Bifidobacteriaceae bacterium]
MTEKRTYGTAGGVPVTDATVAEWNDEVDRRFPPTESLEAMPVRRGRPPLGIGGAAEVLQVRVDPSLAEALTKRAEAEGRTRSQVAREALRAHLAGA